MKARNRLDELIVAVRELRDQRKVSCDLFDEVKHLQQMLRNRDDEVSRLRHGYQLNQHSSRGCPGCEYRNGVFIKHCRLHQEQEGLRQEVARLLADNAELRSKHRRARKKSI